MESTFADDVVKLIELDVKSLIQNLTGYTSEDDDFKRCVDFTMYHILCEKHYIPSESCTRENLEIFATKYDYEGYSCHAEDLNAAVETYVDPAGAGAMSREVKWRVLEFLLLLSSDAFKPAALLSLNERLCVSAAATLPDEFTEEEKIDWCKYLQEGSERFRLPSDDSEDSSHDSDSDISVDTTASKTGRETVATERNHIFDHFPQAKPVVLDENAMFKRTLTDALESKTWLVKNQQHSWWNDKRDKMRAETCIPNDEPTDHQYLEEYKIIRELLWIFATANEQVEKRIQSLRSQVSVPSLIQKTFALLIGDFLDTASKYRELQAYCEQVLGRDVLQMPFSIQAYASVLKYFCRLFLLRVVEEEDIVRKQDSTYTLLTLEANLGPHLNDLKFVHEVHKDCVSVNWPQDVPWLSTVKLLSTVFSKLQTVKSQSRMKILLKIFFGTFRVYANIIDVWLTEGKLYDWRNEFFIKKEPKSSSFTMFPLDQVADKTDLKIASFFYRISERLLICSQNVELLSKLNKIKSIQAEITKEGKLIDVLIAEFVKRLHQLELRRTDVDCNSNEYHELYRDVLKSDVEYFGDSSSIAYLIQAYSKQLGIAPDAVIEPRNGSDRSNDDWVEDLTNLELFPVARVLEQTLCALIERREIVVAELFKSSIVDHYKFFGHVENLSKLLMMDLHSFCNRILIRLEKQRWEGNHLVIMFLYDCVETNKLPFGEQFHFTIAKEDLYTDGVTVCVSEIIKTVDRVSLQYTVRWPLSMIFTDDVISGFYVPLFKLMLKINVAFYAVTRLYFKDLPHTKLWTWKYRRMEMLRHWIVLLLQKLKSYLMVTVSQCLDWRLIESSVKINTFSSMQTHYSSYLQKVKQKCLIEPDMLECLNRALDRVWRVCDDVRDLWTKGAKLQLTDDDVLQSVELYVQALWYLTQIMRTFIVEKRANNPLYDLCADLQRTVEIHRVNIPQNVSFRVNQ